jgi:ABC-type nitrate/sulfonate/bicarbonate transport system permease component
VFKKLRLRTNRLLWAACALGVFAVLALFDPLPSGVKDGPISPWRWFGNLLHNDTRAWALQITDQMVFYGFLLAALAASIGWALQAVIVLGRAALRGELRANRGAA